MARDLTAPGQGAKVGQGQPQGTLHKAIYGQAPICEPTRRQGLIGRVNRQGAAVGAKCRRPVAGGEFARQGLAGKQQPLRAERKNFARLQEPAEIGRLGQPVTAGEKQPAGPRRAREDQSSPR